LIKKWVDWVMSEIKLYDDGLEWSGQPDTWTGTVLTLVLQVHLQMLLQLMPQLQKDGKDTKARDMAAELVNRAWYKRCCY